MSITGWTALGSTGTLVAVLIALVALWVTRRLSIGQEEAQQAANLREAIRTVLASSVELIHMLQDGSVIIAASVETVRLIRDNLGASDSSEDLWRLLADDSATFHHVRYRMDFKSGSLGSSSRSERLICGKRAPFRGSEPSINFGQSCRKNRRGWIFAEKLPTLAIR